jgi:hypothetical protein
MKTPEHYRYAFQNTLNLDPGFQTRGVPRNLIILTQLHMRSRLLSSSQAGIVCEYMPEQDRFQYKFARSLHDWLIVDCGHSLRNGWSSPQLVTTRKASDRLTWIEGQCICSSSEGSVDEGYKVSLSLHFVFNILIRKTCLRFFAKHRSDP